MEVSFAFCGSFPAKVVAKRWISVGKKGQPFSILIFYAVGKRQNGGQGDFCLY